MVPPRSPLPSTMSSCSSIVAITGYLESGSNSVEDAPSRPDHVAGVLDHHALQAQAQAQDRELGFAGELQRAEFAFEAADAEAAGNADRVDAARDCTAPSWVSHSSEGTQRILTLVSLAKPPARRASVTDR